MTTWARFRGSATPTPIRTARTSRSSPTAAAPAAEGRTAGTTRKRESPAVPAQHLLTCTNGHLDEFPYTLWVHRGGACPKAESPDLKMRDANVGKSVGSIIICMSCGANQGHGRSPRRGRPGEAAAQVPRTPPAPQRLRHRMRCPPGVDHDGRLEPVVRRHPVHHRDAAHRRREERTAGRPAARRARRSTRSTQFGAQVEVIRALAGANKIDLAGVSDDDLAAAVAEALSPPETEEQRTERRSNWDPVELLIPEWRYLQKPALFPQQPNDSGLMVTEMPRGPKLDRRISRSSRSNQMKKVNALLGFTRLDAMDRVNDIATRLVKLTRNGRPTWVPATEDRGEGIFLQLDLAAVEEWEQPIHQTPLWAAHRAAHQRNFRRRFSETASTGRPRQPPARRRGTGCCTLCRTS